MMLNDDIKLEMDKNHSDTPPLNKTYTPHDFFSLSKNEAYRYMPNSKKVGHAVTYTENKQIMATQYNIATDANNDLQVRPLVNIESIEPFHGIQAFRAQTPNGTEMYAKRFITGSVGDKNSETDIRVACFSPAPPNGKVFWGSIKPTPLFKQTFTASEKKDLLKELSETPSRSKGGELLKVDHLSVPQRDLTKRNPSQNQVMTESARDAYENFFDFMTDELHPDMKARLKRAFNKEPKNKFDSHYRPEWLHLYGWSLVPMSQNPQVKENLGAGPKWANTQMMILERIVKWFALNSPESLLEIQPKFEMLLDSELIQHIDFKVKVQIKERFVKLTQSIDPFLAYPLVAKASDLAQGTAITYNLLHQVDPASKQVIKKGNFFEKPSGSANQPIDTKTSKETIMPVPSSNNSSSEPSGTHAMGVNANSAKVEASIKRKAVPLNVNVAKHEESAPKKVKYQLTDQDYEKSIVQLFTHNFIADYSHPWRDPEAGRCTGSGFIIADKNNNKYIITNSHVVENSTYVQVRFTNDRIQKYDAIIKCVDYQCDLAMLYVEDPEFNAIATPLDIGHMTDLQKKVTVVGFPLGGTEISLSSGIVSRIQMDTYESSKEDLLQVQVDAAVNHGNSGGPVFSGNKVIGVAFQGYDGYQGLGYIIPVPILKHFIEDVFSGNKYGGFPSLPIETRKLENPSERKYYEMKNRSGVIIQKIDYLSDVFSKLKQDDILISIDGYDISNGGTVNIPGIGKCINFMYLAQMKFLGERVALTVLRRNLKSQIMEEVKVEVILDNIGKNSKKVGGLERDKLPTYYINSGVCFIPLSENYVENGGEAYNFLFSVEESCRIVNTPKKKASDQIILVSSIIKYKFSQGYESFDNAIVTHINGIKIQNMNDVIFAMESNNNSMQVITTSSKTKLIIPKMSMFEQQKLLEGKHISFPWSEDLKPRTRNFKQDEKLITAESQISTYSQLNKPLPQNDPVATKRPIFVNEPVLQTNALIVPQFFKKQPKNLIDQLQTMAQKYMTKDQKDKVELSNEEVNALIEQEDEVISARTPGLNRLQKTISRIEKVYKNAFLEEGSEGDSVEDIDSEESVNDSESELSGDFIVSDIEDIDGIESEDDEKNDVYELSKTSIFQKKSLPSNSSVKNEDKKGFHFKGYSK